MDVISSLPDEVLTHILSFLSTKKAVTTCILSKRWRYLWAYVPALEFSLDEFWTFGSNENERECKDKFERFVNGVLENRRPSRLEKFYYCWGDEDSYSDDSLEWLDRMVVLMPREINFCFHRANRLNLPDSVFSCVSLQNLCLCIFSADRETVIGPELINLPSLKVLELRNIEAADDFTRKLFLGCPALENLILCNCDLGICEIVSDVLKELEIDDSWKTEQIRISCPRLVSLSIRSSDPMGDISLGNMESLANVVIRLVGYDNYASDDPPRILDVLSGLSNATTIELCFLCLQLKEQLEKDIPRCRTFNNLKSLEIGQWDMTKEFDLIACFLKHSPNLQELTLYLDEESHGKTEEEVPRDVLFQHEHLKIVKIVCRNKVELGLEMVKILMRHVKTIGIIVILP